MSTDKFDIKIKIEVPNAIIDYLLLMQTIYNRKLIPRSPDLSAIRVQDFN